MNGSPVNRPIHAANGGTPFIAQKAGPT